MNQKSTEKAVFLSPVFWDYPVMKWSGKKLTIIPPEELDPDKTYVLTVGASAVGHRQNKMGKSYSFAFSTGAEIDSGAIEGAAFSPGGGRKNYDIWVYSVDDSSDVEFMTRIPEYATQVDSLGNFSISNIGPGLYLVIATDDRNDDLFWEPGSESIGLPPFVVSLRKSEAVSGVIFRPERRDTVQAYFSRVNVVDNRRLAIEFSQPVLDDLMLNLESYVIRSSDDTTRLKILGGYIGEENRLILETEPQKPGSRYRLIPINLSTVWSIPFDTAGAVFEGSPSSDTIGPELLSTFPRGGSRNTYQDSVVELTFSERIKVLDFPAAVTVVVDSLDTLHFTPDWISPNLVRLRITGGIPRQREIELTLDPHAVFDIADNSMPDSAIAFSFRLPPADTIGYVTASVGQAGAAPVIGILRPQNRGGNVYESSSDKSGDISFDAVIPGS
ncbi:MAG: Ig-like domain-containing protein, partial [candidate division Zixibacteria bacterium]